MKKILIFSLCALFSLDGASGMEIAEDSNQWGKSVSEPSSPALPDIEEFPLDCVKAQGENVKSIMADILASFGNGWQLASYKNLVSQCLSDMVIESTYLLINVKKNIIWILPPDAGIVFAVLCNKLKGEGDAFDIEREIPGKGCRSPLSRIDFILHTQLLHWLCDTGIRISFSDMPSWKVGLPFRVGRQKYEVQVYDGEWRHLSGGNSASPATVEIPVTKEIGAPISSINVGIYQFENTYQVRNGYDCYVPGKNDIETRYNIANLLIGEKGIQTLGKYDRETRDNKAHLLIGENGVQTLGKKVWVVLSNFFDLLESDKCSYSSIEERFKSQGIDLSYMDVDKCLRPNILYGYFDDPDGSLGVLEKYGLEVTSCDDLFNKGFEIRKAPRKEPATKRQCLSEESLPLHVEVPTDSVQQDQKQAQHSAWLDSLDDDEKLFMGIPLRKTSESSTSRPIDKCSSLEYIELPNGTRITNVQRNFRNDQTDDQHDEELDDIDTIISEYVTQLCESSFR